MPKKPRRSQNATAQRASGGGEFTSGFLAEDPFDLLRDPDFDLNDIDDENDHVDSDEGSQYGQQRHAFSVVEHAIASDPEESTDSEGSDGSSTDQDYEDQVAVNLASSVHINIQAVVSHLSYICNLLAREAINICMVSQGAKKPRLGARGTYSGAARSTRYRKQAELRVAAEGSARLDKFFNKRARLSRTPSPIAMEVDTPLASMYIII